MKNALKSIAIIALFSTFLLTTVAIAQTKNQPSATAPVIKISGTTWIGPDTMGRHYTYEFKPDGSLTYTYENGSFPDGTWTQDGNIIHMTMNNKYSERLGHITGTHMEGDAWNIKGLKWTWQADLK